MLTEEDKSSLLGEDIVALFSLKEKTKGVYETFTGPKTVVEIGRTVRRLTFKY